MSPWFKMSLWTLFLVFVGLMTYKKAWGDEIPPGSLFTQGDVSFCNQLKDAKIVAEAKGTPYEQAVMHKMSDLKRCGWYSGAFLVMKKVKVVNGIGIYYASTVPFEGNPKGYVYMFSAEPKPDPKKET